MTTNRRSGSKLRFIIKCDLCDFKATQYDSLRCHYKRLQHRKIHVCHQFEYKAATKHRIELINTRESNLVMNSVAIKQHQKNDKKERREVIKYDFDQCEYKRTQKSYLNLHRQSKHEGIKCSGNKY